jgi:hypothetical protein
VLESRLRPGEPAIPVTRSHRKARKRARARWFGALSSLGAIDPGDSPQVSMAPAGQSLVGWLTGGRVALALATGRAGAARFGAARLASGGLADNLTLGFGPTGEAVATWTEGTTAPGVFVSVMR